MHELGLLLAISDCLAVTISGSGYSRPFSLSAGVQLALAVFFAILTVPFHCPHVVDMDGPHLVGWVTAAHYSVGPRYLGVHNCSFPE